MVFLLTYNTKEQAIKEAMELNHKEGFHRWKTVSMDHLGNWFADECECETMTPDYSKGYFCANNGSDIVLNVMFTETPICDWVKSVSSVPR